jgi:hypothetical protein
MPPRRIVRWSASRQPFSTVAEGEAISTTPRTSRAPLARRTRKLAGVGFNIEGVLVMGGRQRKVELAFAVGDLVKGMRRHGVC